LLRRSEKWNLELHVTYELDASGDLFWTRMKSNSRLEQFKALAYDALRDARFKFRLCPECQRPLVPSALALLASGPNPQVAESASREEPRDPPSAIPKVEGSRVGALQAREDQDCEATPTITEVVSRTFGAALNGGVLLLQDGRLTHQLHKRAKPVDMASSSPALCHLDM
jgi:hypothetical protein